MKFFFTEILNGKAGARVIDFALVSFIGALASIPTVVSPLTENTHLHTESNVIGLFMSAIMFTVWQNKDLIGGASIGKRKFGLLVVEVTTNKVATPIRCWVRNLTVFIWPLELPWLLADSNRRLGDYLASTKLVNSEERTQANDLNTKTLISTAPLLIFSYFFSVFALWGINLVTDKIIRAIFN